MARFVRVSTQSRAPSPFGSFGSSPARPLTSEEIARGCKYVVAYAPGGDYMGQTIQCPDSMSTPGSQPVGPVGPVPVNVGGGVQQLVTAAKGAPPWLPLALAVGVIVVFFWKGK